MLNVAWHTNDNDRKRSETQRNTRPFPKIEKMEIHQPKGHRQISRMHVVTGHDVWLKWLAAVQYQWQQTSLLCFTRRVSQKGNVHSYKSLVPSLLISTHGRMSISLPTNACVCVHFYWFIQYANELNWGHKVQFILKLALTLLQLCCLSVICQDAQHLINAHSATVSATTLKPNAGATC